MPRSESDDRPTVLRREVEITTALARERILDVHHRFATELVEHAESEMEPWRALDIYSRLHRLRPADAKSVAHKVFVALGRRTPSRAVGREGHEAGPAWDAPESIVSVIRRRVRGRKNAELREWIEYHTGRTEAALLRAHVENAIEFIALLEPARSMADAVTLYAQEMGATPERAELVYYLALEARAIRSGNTADEGHPGGGGTASDHRGRGLRIVEGRRSPGHRAG